MRKQFAIILFITALYMWGCYDKITDAPVGNKPPKTFLALKPDSAIVKQPSRVGMNWWGDDPDGLVVGFYFSWDGVKWGFTTRNDSVFALQIGVKDTTYQFRVMAVDNSGNGVYDNSIVRNGINLGAEPFVDANGNGKYDSGETYYDIGEADPQIAVLPVPIRNSAPTIAVNAVTVLPDTSFPIMTFGWEAADADGDASISSINVVLNDTSQSANVVALRGTARVITLRCKDFVSSNPETEILLDGNENTIFASKLKGIKLNSRNALYVQAQDISGAKSKYIRIPSDTTKWFVRKPKGKFLVIDDYATNDDAGTFYQGMLDTIRGGALNNKYDVWDLAKQKVPYTNTTFQLTLKLFTHIFWYSDNNPSLDLAALTLNRYRDAGGKIFLSLLCPQSVDLDAVRGFLPITNFSDPVNFIFTNTEVVPAPGVTGYPSLKTGPISVARVRGFYPDSLLTDPIYVFKNNERPGQIAFKVKENNLFFIGFPLHRLNNSGNISAFYSKVLFDEFRLVP